jgi:predicted aspartyl protease
MPFEYERTFNPAFPQLSVRIHGMSSGKSSSEASALIDTGADATLIPLTKLQQIEADFAYPVRIASHWGEWRAVQVYRVDLEVAGEMLPAVDVVADDQGETVLLGRNLLNRLILLLDGPQSQTDLLRRRPVRF